MNQLIIPTETVGSSSRPASSTPNTREGGRQAIGTKEWFTSQMPGARSNFPPKIDQIRSRNSSLASVAHLIYPLKLYRAYITTRLRYHGHWRKHNMDKSASTPVTFLSTFLFLSKLPLKNRWRKGETSTSDSIGVRIHTLT